MQFLFVLHPFLPLYTLLRQIPPASPNTKWITGCSWGGQVKAPLSWLSKWHSSLKQVCVPQMHKTYNFTLSSKMFCFLGERAWERSRGSTCWYTLSFLAQPGKLIFSHTQRHLHPSDYFINAMSLLYSSSLASTQFWGTTGGKKKRPKLLLSA